MNERTKIIKGRWARFFGVPAEQIRFFNELTEDQLKAVEWEFGMYRAYDYIYAVKQGGR